MTVVTDYTGILAINDNVHTRWNSRTDLGTATIITYSFADGDYVPTVEESSYSVTSTSAFTSAQRANFRDVIAKYEAISGLIFVETEEEGMISISNVDGSSYGGWANYPYTADNYTSSGNLIVDNSGNYDEGSYGFLTMLHELGHAVGLQHPFDGSVTLDPSVDNEEHTVMTYNSNNPYTENLGTFDLQALQYLYGAAVDVSGWLINYNEAMQVLEVTGDSGANTIFGARGENSLNGGNGGDRLMGREDGDWLSGQGGSDVILGYRGDDTIYGGGGRDVLYGDDADGSSWVYGNDILNGGSGNDRLYGGYGSDTLVGSSGNDVLVGGDSSDVLYGGANNDRVYGGASADQMFGGGGNDSLYGGTSGDTIDAGTGADLAYGSDGNDTMDGGDADDRLYGGSGSDSIYGGDDNDKLYGGTFNDLIRGGTGDDTIYGGTDWDTLHGDSGNDYLAAGSQTDYVYAGTGNDKVYGGDESDYLYGGSGADSIYGGDGNDHIYAGSSSDKIFGGTGSDWIYGGAGNDVIDGGGDLDVFIFNDTSGHDTINGFEDGTDYLTISPATYGIADLSFSAANEGADTLIEVAGYDVSFYLVGMAVADVTTADFANI